MLGLDLVYLHDDSENMKDSFIIQLTDGKHKLQRQVMVEVVQVNDEEPRVIRFEKHFLKSSCLNSVAVEFLRRNMMILSCWLQEQWPGGGTRRSQGYIQH